jgi:hypothetical protein
VSDAAPPLPRQAVAFYLAVNLAVTAFLVFWAVRWPGDFADSDLLVWGLLMPSSSWSPSPPPAGSS